MKKTIIIFSFVLCTLSLGSCSKDQDRTSTGSESPSNPNGPAEDPYAEEYIPNGPQDSSSHASDAGQSSGVSGDKTGNKMPSSDDASDRNKRSRERKDSVTSVAGQQGAGSGVGNGGSINAANDAKK